MWSSAGAGEMEHRATRPDSCRTRFGADQVAVYGETGSSDPCAPRCPDREMARR
jgi:hypothetical protein